MRPFLLTLVLAAAPLVARGAEVPPAPPDCFCTDKSGARRELGETVCLRVDGRAFRARCEMHGNVPSWRRLGEGCAVS